MSFITRIRTLTLTALTAAIVVAPGCDEAATYEALGVTVEDLEVMSADELDALDAELEQLDLAEERLVTHRPHKRPEGLKELRNPLVYTHTEGLGANEDLKIRPRPTHEGEVPAPASDALAAEPDVLPPCDTHGEDVEFAAE